MPARNQSKQRGGFATSGQPIGGGGGFKPAGGLNMLTADLLIDATRSTRSGGSASNVGTAGSGFDATENGTIKYLGVTGSARYLWCGGVSINYFSVPDSAALSITGTIDIIVKVEQASWTGSAFHYWMGKGNAAPLYSYQFLFTNGNRLMFRASPDGTNLRTATATAALTLAAADTPLYVRVLFVPNATTGTVSFYESNDGSTWTQVGTNTTLSGNCAAINDSSSDLFLCALNGSTAGGIFKLYECQIWNGNSTSGGTKVFHFQSSDITYQSPASKTITCTSGQTLTLSVYTAGTTTFRHAIVYAPCWIFNGSNTYLEVPQGAALDIGAATKLTAFVVVRQHTTFVTTAGLIGNKVGAAAGNSGWNIDMGSATLARASISDGTNQDTFNESGAQTTAVCSVYVLVIDRTANTVTLYRNDSQVGQDASIAAGSLINANALRVGRLAGVGTGYFNGEVKAFGMFVNRVLNSSERTSLYNQYKDAA